MMRQRHPEVLRRILSSCSLSLTKVMKRIRNERRQDPSEYLRMTADAVFRLTPPPGLRRLPAYAASRLTSPSGSRRLPARVAFRLVPPFHLHRLFDLGGTQMSKRKMGVTTPTPDPSDSTGLPARPPHSRPAVASFLLALLGSLVPIHLILLLLAIGTRVSRGYALASLVGSGACCRGRHHAGRRFAPGPPQEPGAGAGRVVGEHRRLRLRRGGDPLGRAVQRPMIPAMSAGPTHAPATNLASPGAASPGAAPLALRRLDPRLPPPQLPAVLRRAGHFAGRAPFSRRSPPSGSSTT